MDLIKKQFLQWHMNIEKKIPCHFCGAKLSEKIFSCGSGHDCCFPCKTESCIACPGSNSFFRNHIAEILISQFNNLKSCAEQLDVSTIEKKNDNTNSKKVNKATETTIERHNKTSMVTEKDINTLFGNKPVTESKPQDKSSVNGSTQFCEGKSTIQPKTNLPTSLNLYSCWIGTCCFRAIYENILEHMKASHSSVFTSHSFKGWPHVLTYDLVYSGANSRQDFAFELQGIGLFVLHISATHKENLKAHVLMFDSGKIAAQYGYNVEIKCDDQKKSFSAVVDSSKIPRKNLLDCTKGLFINENSLLLNTIKLRLHFKCIVEINTFNKSIFNGSFPNPSVGKVNDEKPRQPNKPRFKPRRNFSNAKTKPSIPGLLELKLPNPPATQVQPFQQTMPDYQVFQSLFDQFMANMRQPVDCKQDPQVHQSSSVNSTPNVQPPPPVKTAIINQQVPQNIVVDQQSRGVSQVPSVPTQSAPQNEDLLIFDESSKSEDSNLNNSRVQNVNPNIDPESEETDQPAESDSKPNDCKVN